MHRFCSGCRNSDNGGGLRLWVAHLFCLGEDAIRNIGGPKYVEVVTRCSICRINIFYEPSFLGIIESSRVLVGLESEQNVDREVTQFCQNLSQFLLVFAFVGGVENVIDHLNVVENIVGFD